MTIDELGTQMKQIDPNLELYFYKDYKVPDHISYEEDGVEHVLYEFLKNKFDKYECSKTIGPFQFIKLQNLISYFFDDTYNLHLNPDNMLKERVKWLEAENKRLEQTNDRLVERNQDLTRTLKIMMEIKSDK